MQGVRSLPAIPAPPRRLGWSPTTMAPALGVAIVALAALVVVLALPAHDDTVVHVVLQVGVVGIPVVAALRALGDPRTARFGWALLGAAGLWALSGLAASGDAVAYSVGRIALWWALPMIAFLLLAFPDGRISRVVERRLLQAMIAVVGLLFVGSVPFIDMFRRPSPWGHCDGDCPANAFQLVDEPALVGTLRSVREVVLVGLFAAITVALARRRRRTRRHGRAAGTPAFLAAIGATLVLAGFLTVRGAAPGGALTEVIGVGWMLCLPALAVAFSAGIVRRRLTLGSILGRLARELAGSPRELSAALQGTLDDPAVGVLTRDRARAVWVGADGEAITELQLARRGLMLHEIWDHDGPVAAVVLDAELDRDSDLVEGVVGLVEAAVREAWLAEELASSLEQLDESRQRIATAADQERRRIERDLHDGAQQRLIALRMRLSIAEDLLDCDPQAASSTIHALGDDVDQALEEIRALAHGIYPALLADRGLTDALRSVARRLPLRVDVRTTGLTRQSPEIEAAVYFTCVEALQNVVKHARGATGARIVLRQGTELEFHVADDGVGFDPPRRRDGAGMRNMRDRVESVGGTLAVRSWPGRGTAVYGVVPLGDRSRHGRVDHDRPRDPVV